VIYVIGEPLRPDPNRSGRSAPGPVKIGCSAAPEKRLRALRNVNTPRGTIPSGVWRNRLELHYTCEGSQLLEQALHLYFADLRIVGEWFALNPIAACRRIPVAIEEIYRIFPIRSAPPQFQDPAGETLTPQRNRFSATEPTG
jgi:hypothetical protein